MISKFCAGKWAPRGGGGLYPATDASTAVPPTTTTSTLFVLVFNGIYVYILLHTNRIREKFIDNKRQIKYLYFFVHGIKHSDRHNYNYKLYNIDVFTVHV
jgi:hypothetical protein